MSYNIVYPVYDLTLKFRDGGIHHTGLRVWNLNTLAVCADCVSGYMFGRVAPDTANLTLAGYTGLCRSALISEYRTSSQRCGMLRYQHLAGVSSLQLFSRKRLTLWASTWMTEDLGNDRELQLEWDLLARRRYFENLRINQDVVFSLSVGVFEEALSDQKTH